MFAAFLTTILYSISFVCGHRSAKLIGGTEANFWRLTLAVTFLGLWSYSFGHGLSGDSFPMFLFSGIIGIGIADVALYQALPRLGSRLTILLVQCLSAPIGALIEWVWLGTALSLAQILCGIIILAGVGLALTPSEHLRLTRRELVTGGLFSLLAAAGGALGAVLSRKAFAIAQNAHQPMDGGTATFQRVVGGLFVGGICLLIVKRRAFRIQANAPHKLIVEASMKKWRGVWLWLLANSVSGQTLGSSCMQWALKTMPAGIVLAIIALSPVVVIPFAVVVEGERPTWRSFIGGVIAVAGVIALTWLR